MAPGASGGPWRARCPHRARVVLLGRSAPHDLDDLTAELRAAGGDLRYLRADVTDEVDLARAVAQVRAWFGRLNGVLHGAGVTDDALFRDKTDAAFHRVLAPKIDGTSALDCVTGDDELDFFATMSSIVGVFGNAGQTDYAAANAYLDAFAEWRATQVRAGVRHGRSVSIIWPSWHDGGIRMPDAVREHFATTLGQRPIRTGDALRALDDLIGHDGPVLVGCGDQELIEASLLTAGHVPSVAVDGMSGETLVDTVRAEAAALLNVAVDEVLPDVEFGAQGFNSLLFTDFTNRLNSRFGLTLSPAALFEHPTARSLAAHLDGTIPAPQPSFAPESHPAPHPEPEGIAVIGMAGRLPGGTDLDEFWRTLIDGRCVTGDRPGDRPGLWEWPGGFLDDVTAFDAGFFGISPREARLMDPQQRLFLESAWHAIEHAGYDPRSVAGTATGVFAAVTLHDYSELLARTGEEVHGHTITGHVHGVVANRLSYLLDLSGPSEVVDTACSSSLTALHRAVRALEAGECDTAVVGGVNVLLTGDWFASLDKAGVLSPTGRCWTFDDRADGFVRSEGVGVVVLKPLAAARRDGDTVHGVIRGTAVNHGGRGHSLTAPSPAGQARVIVSALRRAGVDPRTVSYVETHGTGTKLGDPVEVSGLRMAFSELGASGPEPWCGLGAVKGNVGHLESAAGLAGLLKVLLAFRHKMLPRNAAGERQNSHLDLSGGPFTLLSETAPWTPTDRDGTAMPRRAGVSAFGFGGANAHVVLEEPAPDEPAADAGGDEIVVLSAVTSAQLRRYAHGLRDALDGSQVSLADLAYTSRVGRTPMPVRLAVVASTTAALADALIAYLDDRDAPGLHTSDRTPGTHALAQRWVAGEDVEWPAMRRRRVPFPVYPFDHSVRHGPELAQGTGDGPGLFERTWRRAVRTPDRPVDGGRCVLIVGRDSVLPLLEALPGRAEVDWIVVREASPLPAVGPLEYEVDFADHAAGLELAERIVRSHGPVRLLLDLADVTGGHETGREAARIGLLQVLVGHARAGELRVAQLTRGVAEVGNPEPSLTGARFAGLVRAVGAEYRAVHAVTVDVDCAADDLHTQLDIGLRELAAAGGEPEIAHRAGGRWVPRLTRAAVRGRGTFAVQADRTYLVTGGTGGLGLAAAERLVARGARRIALTGRRPLPGREQWDDTRGDEWWQERVAAIRRMEGAGADVRVLTGSLTDETALSAFVGTLAPVAGVLHCAGCLTGEPAFVRKSFDDISRCWEPKGEGLLTLLRVLDGQTPDFVVLFSSISSAVPELAVGLSDYASANAFLDAVAAHRNARTRFLAIGWGSWSGAGMGEVMTPRYRERGLSALTVTEGLDLLEQALATDGPTRVIAVHGDPTVGEAPAVAPATQDVPDVRRRFAEHLRRTFADALLLDVAAVRPDRPFTDLGVDSILIASVVPSLEALTGAPVEPSVILEHPTVDRLTDHLMAHHGDGVARWAGGQEPPLPSVVAGDRPVTAPVLSAAAVPLAIIGMAGRFPGAETTDAFWELLRTGRSGVTEVPRSRWDVATRYSPEPRDGMSIGKWGGFLHGIEEFDPGYFGIAAEDAAHMDPLIRLFLECAATTFADAGYAKGDIAGIRTGVFAGSGTSNYASRITVPGRATATGSNQNFIAAHVAHVYDLRGPNIVVDTACSSSLSSLYLARQALLLGECDLALVGGADLLLDETPYLSLSAARALSPDGACHVFDAAANGLVPGEGVGAVLLKRLDRALADGDRVHAVLESVAMNNDGRTMGLTTPNPDAQQQVVLDALTKAGADAGSVSYVEAHGTGTMIGDPIELRALTHVFERFTTERGFCAVGSVKSNIGHLLMAAGMASLQKVVLALRHHALPATLHCDRPNPRFAFDASPFFPNRELREWLPRQRVRRAGISAFGFGGTNCHAIVRDLTTAERESHAVRRSPLPAPEFHRARFWVDRERPALPAPRRMFELEELA